jgi:hypothetical protein
MAYAVPDVNCKGKNRLQFYQKEMITKV